MKKRRIISIIPAAALLLLAACTREEAGGGGHELPYGVYPLQIGGVTLGVEGSAGAWSAEGANSRVVEDNDDGKSSAWQWNGSERIGVRLDGEIGIYTLNSDRTLTPEKQL